MLHVVALAQYATAYTRSRASNCLYIRLRLKAANHRLQQETALMREEIRIKDARMMLITPQRRPQCRPVPVSGHPGCRSPYFSVGRSVSGSRW
jgi:hypothetical protein